MKPAALLWIAVMLTLAVLVPGIAAGRIWDVRVNGSGDAPTLTAGIDSASAGDTVRVWPGTYYECGIALKPQVKVISRFGADSTTIDGQSQGRIMICADVHSPAALKGFTITGGHAIGGAGMFIRSSTLTVEDCIFLNNYAARGGGILSETHGDFTLKGCVFEGNIAEETGGAVCLTDESSPDVSDCVFSGNSALEGGAFHCSMNSNPRVSDCLFSGNTAYLGGGLTLSEAYACTVAYCAFSGNTATYQGGAAALLTSLDLVFTGCSFAENYADFHAGGLYSSDTAGRLVGCIFDHNRAGMVGGASLCEYGSTVFQHCSFSGNASPQGGAVYLDTNAARFENSIVAFGNPGEGIGCVASACSLFCCDVFGNVCGDWVGPIAGQYGLNGNFSSDPMFCDTLLADLHLQTTSPCAEANNPGCGRVGSFGIACLLPAHPVITDVVDIPADQGGWVRVYIQRSEFDSTGVVSQVETYTVWRRLDNPAMMKSMRSLLASGKTVTGHRLGLPLLEWQGREFVVVQADREGQLMPPGVWEVLGSFAAIQQDEYVYVARTLADSTDAGAIHTVFCVTAHTPVPSVWYESRPDSGCSIDNLAPSPPPGLTLVSPAELTWDAVPEPDFDYFTVYGSASASPDSSSTLLGFTVATSMDISDMVYDYYHVTARDFAGNESEASTVVNTYVGVDRPAALPESYALCQNRPNPFRSETLLRFDMPKPGTVTLRVFDMTGRLIKKLADAEYPAGRHTVRWNGEDNRGRRVNSGVYFSRLEVGGFTATTKVMVLR